MAELNTPVTGCELILGGQKSGKSRRAESLAANWLAGPAENGLPRQATFIATAQPWDAEMQQRIARHQADRAVRVPGMATLEEPLALADAIARLSAPHHLLVVDCLTLWLTNLLMPADAGDNGVQGSSRGLEENNNTKSAFTLRWHSTVCSIHCIVASRARPRGAGGQRNWPGGDPHGRAGAPLCGHVGSAQPGRGRQQPARGADGGWAASLHKKIASTCLK
jgi:adenosyl cobinamide kinase/adenosyl cobinamide phosphate guanylyltransferase